MPSKARTYAVTVRFSSSEKEKLDDVADQNGITISDVIRMCVNRVHASGEFIDLSQVGSHGSRVPERVKSVKKIPKKRGGR